MATFDRVRILVLGDSGVGKTSLVHLMSQGQPLRQLSYTIGATVEVKLHEYREGTPAQKTFWIGRNILHFRIIFAESYSGFSDFVLVTWNKEDSVTSVLK